MLIILELLFIIILGYFIGSLYGGSLELKKERTSSFYISIFYLFRLIILLIIFIYLLILLKIRFIIFLVSFLIGYWFYILNYNY